MVGVEGVGGLHIGFNCSMELHDVGGTELQLVAGHDFAACGPRTFLRHACVWGSCRMLKT